MTTIIRGDDDNAEKLNAYLAIYDDLELKAKEAAERFEVVKLAVKGELARLAPQGETSIEAVSPFLEKSLHLRHSERTTVDVKRLKAEQPMIHAQYVQKAGRWELRRGQ